MLNVQILKIVFMHIFYIRVIIFKVNLILKLFKNLTFSLFMNYDLNLKKHNCIKKKLFFM